MTRRVRRAWQMARLLMTRHLWRVEVEGQSMMPTLTPGQIVWCEAHPRAGSLRVGDIVVLQQWSMLPVSASREDSDQLRPVSAIVPAQFEIKRLSALGTDGTAPAGFCEVLGDNRAHSADSRHYGPIPMTAIAARVLDSASPQEIRSRGQ